MLVSSFIACLGSGCARHLYNSSELTWHARRLSNKELPKGCSLAIVHV